MEGWLDHITVEQAGYRKVGFWEINLHLTGKPKSGPHPNQPA
jgi:hypothetical protein